MYLRTDQRGSSRRSPGSSLACAGSIVMGKKHIFKNSAGESFNLFPLNPLEEQEVRIQIQNEWKAAGKTLPELPTYSATNAAGETILIQIKEGKDADTPELQAAWEHYTTANAAFENEYSERFLISCFAAVDANPDDFPAWAMRMKMRNLPIPTDAADKQILFGRTWVIRSTDDIASLIIACTRTMTNMSEETAAAAEAMFRGSVERAVAGLVGFETGPMDV